MFNLINHLCQKLLLLVFSFPKRTILFFLFITLTGLFFTQRLEINVSTKTLLNPKSKVFQNLNHFEDLFGPQRGLIILFSGNVYSGDIPCQIHQILEREKLTNPDLASIRSPFSVRNIEDRDGKILYPTLVASPCSQATIDFSDLKKTSLAPFLLATNPKSDLLYEVKFKTTQILRDGTNAYDPNIIKNFIDQLKLKTSHLKSVDLHFAGSLASTYYSHEGVQYNQRLNFYALTAILLIGYLFWGTFLGTLFFIITLIVMMAVLYGVMGALGFPIDMLNAGIVLLLIITTIEDFAFIAAMKINSHKSFKEITQTLITPSFYTSLTTFIGFGSLYFTNMPTIQRLGVMAALGAMLEWATTFFLFPAFISIFPSLEKSFRPTPVFNFLERLRFLSLTRKLTYPLLLAFIFGTFFILSPTVSEDPFDIYHDLHPFKTALKMMRDKRGWETNMDIVFNNYKDEEQNRKIIDKIKTDPQVLHVTSYYSTIDDFKSKVKTKENLDLVLRDFKGSTDYSNLISKSGETRATIFLKNSRVENSNALINQIESWCEQGKVCFATGNAVAYTTFAMQVPKALLESLVASLLLVTITLLYIAHHLRVKHKLPIIISSLWGPFAIFSLMLVFKIPVNFLTCLFASVIVGLTGDNAIQYMFAAQQGVSLSEGIDTKSGGSIQIFTIIVLASLLSLFSYFKFSRDLGMIIIAGMFLSLLGDLWILKALIKKKN